MVSAVKRIIAFEFRTTGDPDTLVYLRVYRVSNMQLPMREYRMSAAARYMWRSTDPMAEWIVTDQPHHQLDWTFDAAKREKDMTGLIRARLYLDILDENGLHCQQCIDWVVGTMVAREPSYTITDSGERFRDL